MIKTKKQMFTMIGAFLLVIMLGTITYAFFNYTRTGTANVIRTGRISFNTTQNGTLNLTNVFPVSSNSVGNDYTTDTVKINITGDTIYTEGIEYLVTAESVNVETSTGKKVPLTLKVDVTNNLGTEDTDNDQIEYFTDRGGNKSYYKNLSESVLYDGQYLLVGYIAPGQIGVDGTINIKAYLNENRVAISDTYDGTESDANGTASSWVNNRVVLTTNEWNALQQQGNELSFKVRIEANEGIWVDPAVPINSVGSIPANLKENITEIYFVKETPIRMQQRYDAASVKADMTDTTLNEGKVLGWQEGNKLYIASTGKTYFPAVSTSYFFGMSNVEKIEFENIDTSRVTNMAAMFNGCSSLNNIDVSSFNTSNVTSMAGMFINCGVTTLDLTNFDTNKVTNMDGMIMNCPNLTEINVSGLGSDILNDVEIGLSCSNLKKIDMSNFNFGTTNMFSTFYGSNLIEEISLENAIINNFTNLYFGNLQHLEVISLAGINMSSITSTSSMFNDDSNLKTIYVSNTWDISDVTNSENMFRNCTSLVGGNGTTYDANHIDKEYARIDTPSTLGYLTLKNN